MVVPTFKELICKIQILTFFRIMSSLGRTHIKQKPDLGANVFLEPTDNVV
ncbi:hypothetical protein LEP1GSC020_0106 [Leptospira interrogans serovar Grippotyphosa str. 2006006986]|nr:hypothetical protein LEP1GSC069_1808 [Leptospira interrogans serovar Canicola str. Fiocruz LV133]EKO86896.1 hypothetical protein LEP1GSC009_0431 [Leptospira interrogans serovar Grippotyphosa str. Andaman]EKP83342.1 hypothetical protein LEP1GSC020_0106 [Leptospira interrogans serovar Grippotyphosa str. 2006006986]EMK17323.1 hypothetical protein LEP1GSC075_1461 [Leptospira interrogans str. Kito]EMN68662.1 hypothetical protein LEP1GSC098_0459 [Leptospira interrogans serovar Grippotyphosa str. U